MIQLTLNQAELGLIELALESHIDKLRTLYDNEEGYVHPAADYMVLLKKVEQLQDKPSNELDANFYKWACEYFEPDGQNINTLVVKEYAFRDFEYKHKKGWKVQTFSNALCAFCESKGYIYNPEQLINSTGGRGRIVHKVEEKNFDRLTGEWAATGRMVPKDMIYIKTTE